MKADRRQPKSIYNIRKKHDLSMILLQEIQHKDTLYSALFVYNGWETSTNVSVYDQVANPVTHKQQIEQHLYPRCNLYIFETLTEKVDIALYEEKAIDPKTTKFVSEIRIDIRKEWEERSGNSGISIN